jgi:anaerobic selenocysteine-containing dehydrogenase
MAEFTYANVEKEMKLYGYDGVVKSHCRMCHGGCGVLVYTKNGKAVKISGDPDCPINHGTLCTKGFASLQLAYHPDRLTYPVRRMGPKGSGQWERISWDEALDTIATRILDYKDNFGAESVVMKKALGSHLKY